MKTKVLVITHKQNDQKTLILFFKQEERTMFDMYNVLEKNYCNDFTFDIIDNNLNTTDRLIPDNTNHKRVNDWWLIYRQLKQNET